MRSQPQTLKIALVSLMLILPIFGCAARQLVIYPIKGTDICFKDDPECNMYKMDVGFSNFYFNKVLDIKNAKQ